MQVEVKGVLQVYDIHSKRGTHVGLFGGELGGCVGSKWYVGVSVSTISGGVSCHSQ